LPSQGLDRTRSKDRAWNTLGTQADRNKENNMMPARWTSHKVFLWNHKMDFPRTTIHSVNLFLDNGRDIPYNLMMTFH
jgi:checkpoint serine/threonine-protein kinase